MSGFRGSQKILEVAVLGEDICERFVHDFISGGVEKSGVLVDLSGGRFIQSYAGCDLANLDDFKQWHWVCPFRWYCVVN